MPDTEWSIALVVVWELGVLVVFFEVVGVLYALGARGVLEVLGVEACLSGVGRCTLSTLSGSGAAPPSEA